MAVTLQTAARDAACNAIVDLVDAGAGAGVLEFKTADNATKGTNQAAECPFSATAFDAAGSAGGNSAGVSTAEPITSDTDADGGTAIIAYFYDSDNNAILSCSVGTGSGDISMSSNVFGAGDTIAVTALTVTVPAS